ncbi:MAG TPA: YIP1 family protein [Ignavibacteria bacterium]|nr:YIP1 family protein [Ignavibacteria bacterium]
MEENTQSAGFIPEPPEEFTTTDAMVGVFTEPGETYESVSRNPGKNYWILPVIIFVVLNLISTFVTFSDPEILGNVMDERMETARKQIEEQVKSGELSREKGDEAIAAQEQLMDPSSPFFIIIGYTFAVAGPFVVLFLLSLLYFVGLKTFKSEATYSAVLNVVGLALLISGIQAILTSVISILMGKLTVLSLGMFTSADQLGQGLFSFINSIDVFSIWLYIVISIGLIKVGKISAGQAYGMVFGIWILWTAITSLMGGAFA